MAILEFICKLNDNDINALERIKTIHIVLSSCISTGVETLNPVQFVIRITIRKVMQKAGPSRKCSIRKFYENSFVYSSYETN